MRKKCLLAILAIYGLVAAIPIFAATKTFPVKPVLCSHAMPWWLHPVMTISGGIATAQVGRTQTLTMDDDFTTYAYAKNGAYSSKMIWGTFIGTEIPLHPDWALQLGFGYYQPASFSSGTGILTQGIDESSSDQYPYSYQVISRQLLAEGKLLWRVKERFHPFATLGLGAAFNYAYNYTVTIPPFTAFSPQFTSHSNTAFSYSVGAGMDIDINKNWRIGGGYRYTDLGKTKLGAGLIDATPFTSTLTQSNLYAQEVMANITYLIF